MKGKGERKEIWGHDRHDRSAQIHLLGSRHHHTTFCSHCSISHAPAQRAGEKEVCHFFLHHKSSESTWNVEVTYFRSSIRKRKLFDCFSTHLKKLRMSIGPLAPLWRHSNKTQLERKFAGWVLLPNMKELFFLLCYAASWFFSPPQIPGSTLTAIYFPVWMGRRHEFKLQNGDLK